MEISSLGFRNKLVILIVLIGISACNSKKETYSDTGILLQVAEYNKNGELHGLVVRYSDNGYLNAKIHFKNGIKHGEEIHYDTIGNIISIYNMIDGKYDTVKYFYKSGEVERILYPKNDNFYEKSFYKSGIIRNEGLRGKTNEEFLGWWNSYDKSGMLLNKIEFKNIEGKEHKNQLIQYDKDGNIIIEESNFYKLSFPDTLVKDKIIQGVFDLNTYLSKDQDFYQVFFHIQDENGNTILKDTSFGRNEKAAIIKYKPARLGKFTLNGIALEKGYNIEPSKDDTTMVMVDHLSHRIYFEKLFVVVE